MGIRMNLDPELDHQFRENAMKKFGYRKGALTQALIEAINLWLAKENQPLLVPPAPITKLSSLTCQSILKLLHNLLPELKRKYHIKKIGVFGSYARDEATIHSDVDILVEFGQNPGLLKFIEIKNFLTQKIGIKVDLVDRNNMKEEIRDTILKEVIYA